MNRFATGIVAGGMLTVVGLSWLMSDNKTRRRLMRSGKRAVRRTENAISGVTDRF